MSAGPWAAVIGGIFAANNKKKPLINKYGLTKWISFESLDEKVKVDFVEHEKEFVNSIKISEDKIKYKGIIFKYKYEYFINEKGNIIC